jgi:hypothetical protein
MVDYLVRNILAFCVKYSIYIGELLNSKEKTGQSDGNSREG